MENSSLKWSEFTGAGQQLRAGQASAYRTIKTEQGDLRTTRAVVEPSA